MSNITRTIHRTLLAWRDAPRRKPLVVRGARQVGKSTAVQIFANRAFDSFVTINFERRRDYRGVFEADLDPKRILAELEIKARATIKAGSTLLFLDEIQDCPAAIASLRYFHEEMPELHVIAAGSLLEFALEEVGMPVGRVEFAWLYPLSFSEYLNASGRGALAEQMPTYDVEHGVTFSLTEVMVQEMYKALHEYMIVGGMPEAVVTYLATGSFAQSDNVLDQIATSFLDDIHKYARGDKQIANVGLVLKRLFQFVGREVTYSTLGEADLGQRTATSVSLLEKAMLCHRVRSASPASLPLAGSAADKHFKCILLDIGLARRMAGLESTALLRGSDLMAAYDGRAAEQFVGQNLLAEGLAAGSEGRQLFCWIRPQKSAKAEVDYLLARHGQVLPIEVKSGSTGRMRSLRVLMDEFANVKQGVCLKQINAPLQQKGIVELPLFTRL